MGHLQSTASHYAADTFVRFPGLCHSVAIWFDCICMFLFGLVVWETMLVWKVSVVPLELVLIWTSTVTTIFLLVLTFPIKQLCSGQDPSSRSTPNWSLTLHNSMQVRMIFDSTESNNIYTMRYYSLSFVIIRYSSGLIKLPLATVSFPLGQNLSESKHYLDSILSHFLEGIGQCAACGRFLFCFVHCLFPPSLYYECWAMDTLYAYP